MPLYLFQVYMMGLVWWCHHTKRSSVGISSCWWTCLETDWGVLSRLLSPSIRIMCFPTVYATPLKLPGNLPKDLDTNVETTVIEGCAVSIMTGRPCIAAWWHQQEAEWPPNTGSRESKENKATNPESLPQRSIFSSKVPPSKAYHPQRASWNQMFKYTEWGGQTATPSHEWLPSSLPLATGKF